MLVLSRKYNESILVGSLDQDIVLKRGELIRITVVDIRGDKTRLGISARPDIPVHREEIVEVMKEERRRDAWQPKEGRAE